MTTLLEEVLSFIDEESIRARNEIEVSKSKGEHNTPFINYSRGELFILSALNALIRTHDKVCANGYYPPGSKIDLGNNTFAAYRDGDLFLRSGDDSDFMCINRIYLTKEMASTLFEFYKNRKPKW
jgi:hypothetical protein